MAIAPMGIHSAGTPNCARKPGRVRESKPKNEAPSPSLVTASKMSSAVNPVSTYQYGTRWRDSSRSVRPLSGWAYRSI
jgi:hypothetical protein